MYIMSFKLDKTKLLIFAAACAVIIFTLIWASPKAEVVSAPKAKDITIKTEEDRIAFLKSFGWEVLSEPVEVMEIIVPSEFDNVYEQYNYVQKLQGYDLTKYRGKRVKRWTYRVTNYPGKPEDTINANLLVYNEKVIGGDICSTALGGFIHGFEINTISSESKAGSSAGKSTATTSGKSSKAASGKAASTAAGKSSAVASGKSTKTSSKAASTAKTTAASETAVAGDIGDALTTGD